MSARENALRELVDETAAGLEREHGLTPAGRKYAAAHARYRLGLRKDPPDDPFTGTQGFSVRAWVDYALEPELRERGLRGV